MSAWFRILLLKAYLDKGVGLTYYFKYVIYFVGLYSVAKNIRVEFTGLLALAYVVAAFFLGYVWFKLRIVDIENEIQNMYNPFQREVRESINHKA